MDKVILDWDSNKKKAIINSPFYLEMIRESFSIPNKIKKLAKFSHCRGMADRIYAISKKGLFERGLTAEIVKYCIKNDIDYEISNELFDKIKIPSSFPIENLKLHPREYQTKAVEKALKYGNGNFVIGTGGGKTLLMAMILRTFGKRALICLPSHLVSQTHKDFIEYGIPEEEINIWTSKNEHEINSIVIISYSLLQRRLSKKENIEIYQEKFNQIELLLFDEVHSLRRDNKINKTFKIFDHIYHRFGFTGTLPECKMDKWNILGKIGPILIDINSDKLRKEGYLTNVSAKVIKLFYNNPPNFTSSKTEPNKAYLEEKEFIAKSNFRNSVIKKLANRLTGNTLILIDRLEQGDLLYDTIKTLSNKKCFWVNGEVNLETREKIRQLMESDNNIVCIAMTKIFSTGINIKNLHNIIFGQAGKAKVTMIQSIGRGLRLSENKERLILVDIADMLRYGVDHFSQREKRYIEENISYEIHEIHQQSSTN